MSIRTISALFDNYEAAAAAVDRIEAAGTPQSDIAVVASNEGDRNADRVGAGGPSSSEADRSSAAEGAGAGATVGTVLGGGVGLLAGLGLLAIPGVGPVVAAGWLIASVTGAGVGAATGGLFGALTGAGLSESEAEAYAEGVRRGGTLVTVRADDAQADRVADILAKGGSVDMDERAEGWRAQGWTGGTGGTSGAVPQGTTTPALDPAARTEPVHPDPGRSPASKRSPDIVG